MSKQVRAARPRPYLLTITQANGLVRRIRFSSRYSADVRTNTEARYVGGFNKSVRLDDTSGPTAKVIREVLGD